MNPALSDRPSVIERAFQIAKSGKVANIGENVAMALTGRALSQQISRMIVEARATPN